MDWGEFMSMAMSQVKEFDVINVVPQAGELILILWLHLQQISNITDYPRWANKLDFVSDSNT